MSTESKQLLSPAEAGQVWLREELDRLQKERMPLLEGRLRALHEHSEFDDLYAHLARQELARVRERIVELERLLSTAPAMPAPHALGAVAIGSRVVVEDDAGRAHTFVIVSPVEADAARGHISASSPVGAALLGHRAGDRVMVVVPTGQRTFSVMSVV